MNLKQIEENAVSFEEAKQKIKRQVIEACSHGWKLHSGAIVTVERHEEFTWYTINQTLNKGKQKLKDYDIIYTNFCDSLDNATAKMEELLTKACEEGWKLEGGLSFEKRFTKEHPERLSCKAYHTIIKQ